MATKKPTANNAVGGAAAGGAIGVIIVIAAKTWGDVEWDATEASAMTAAVGTLAAFLFRYLRKPSGV